MALLEIRGLPHCPIENGVWNHVSYGAILKTWPGSPAVDQQVAEQNNSSSVVKPQTGETVECPGRNICIRTLATTGLGTSMRSWKVSYKIESQVSTHCNNPHVKIQKRLLYLHWLAWVRCWRSIIEGSVQTLGHQRHQHQCFINFPEHQHVLGVIVKIQTPGPHPRCTKRLKKGTGNQSPRGLVRHCVVLQVLNKLTCGQSWGGHHHNLPTCWEMIPKTSSDEQQAALTNLLLFDIG